MQSIKCLADWKVLMALPSPACECLGESVHQLHHLARLLQHTAGCQGVMPVDLHTRERGGEGVTLWAEKDV